MELTKHRQYSCWPTIGRVLGIAVVCLVSVPQMGAPSEEFVDAGRPWVHVSGQSAAASGVDERSSHPEAPRCAKPLALAAGDLDEDGVPDLMMGCEDSEGGGVVVVYRGREQAVYPRAWSGSDHREPFVGPGVGIVVPSRAEFVFTGDFNGDGRLDVVVAARGSRCLQLLPGNGRGRLGPPEPVVLPGRVTDLVSGEFNRRDGLPDLVVGVETGDGSRLLVFQSADGALRRPATSVAVPGKVIDLAFGQLDGHFARDLAVATEAGLVVVHGRDRSGKHPEEGHAVDRWDLSFEASAIAVGDFLWEPVRESEIALLSSEGVIHLMRRTGEAVDTTLTRDTVGRPTWKTAAVRNAGRAGGRSRVQRRFLDAHGATLGAAQR